MKRLGQEPFNHLGEPHENLLRRSAVESDRKFWSGERPISAVQGVGLVVTFVGLIALIGVSVWPKSGTPWWKMVDTYGTFLAVFGCAFLLLFLRNRVRFRRKTHPRKKD